MNSISQESRGPAFCVSISDLVAITWFALTAIRCWGDYRSSSSQRSGTICFAVVWRQIINLAIAGASGGMESSDIWRPAVVISISQSCHFSPSE